MLKRAVGNTIQNNDKHALVVIARCVTILSPLFGLTWGFGIGIKALPEAAGLHIVFAVLNSLQVPFRNSDFYYQKIILKPTHIGGDFNEWTASFDFSVPIFILAWASVQYSYGPYATMSDVQSDRIEGEGEYSSNTEFRLTVPSRDHKCIYGSAGQFNLLNWWSLFTFNSLDYKWLVVIK